MFNQERYLIDPEKKNVAKEKKEDQPQKPEINFDKLLYNGSLIIGNTAKALIGYPEPIKPPKGKKKLIRRSNYRKTNKSQKSKIVKKTVKVGDSIGSFHVSQILADKIVFKNGEKKIEKMLFDSNKKRTVIRKNQKKTRSSRRKVTSKRRRVTTSTRQTARKPKVVQSRMVRKITR